MISFLISKTALISETVEQNRNENEIEPIKKKLFMIFVSILKPMKYNIQSNDGKFQIGTGFEFRMTENIQRHNDNMIAQVFTNNIGSATFVSHEKQFYNFKQSIKQHTLLLYISKHTHFRIRLEGGHFEQKLVRSSFRYPFKFFRIFLFFC